MSALHDTQSLQRGQFPCLTGSNVHGRHSTWDSDTITGAPGASGRRYGQQDANDYEVIRRTYEEEIRLTRK